MAMSDDDDLEPQLNVLKDYYLIDAENRPVCFSVLPCQFMDADEIPESHGSVFLRGTDDAGGKFYKKVLAWKVGFQGKQPEISVLSAEGGWIRLLKPKNSYEETIRSILITVQMLHFFRRKPQESEKNLWIHLRKVFKKFDVRPSVDDIRNHRSLVKQFAEIDLILAKSEILHALAEEGSRKRISEVGSYNAEIKESFIDDDGDIEEMVEFDEEEEEEDLFNAICAICDNGGDLLCCDGPCMRSFHAKIGTGEDSYCETLGYTEPEVEAMKTFLCMNCEYKQHQCFICGILEPSDGPTAKVFICNNATCGHFYHPKCVAQQLHPHNRKEALELEKNIADGSPFTCPIHWCSCCNNLEDRTQEHLQFAVCRRCPKSFHRKCLPRQISFEDIEDEDITTRAWELSKRILIYCLDHEIDSDIDTPVRNHIKFPRIRSIEKPAKLLEKSTKVLIKKRKRTIGESDLHQPSKEPVMMQKKIHVQKTKHVGSTAVKNLSEHLVRTDKKELQLLQESKQAVQNMAMDASTCSPNTVEEKEKQLHSSTARKIPQSSFPLVDKETEKRVLALVEKEVSSLTLKDISRKCLVPSTHSYSGRQVDRIIATGKLERSVQAVNAALKKLENGDGVNSAKAVCEPEVLRQLAKWHTKLRVYISPFIYGTRYSSFGRHFTKVEKLVEIVDKLHWYVEPGDMIVDFCCGSNDFSHLMEQKLDEVQKKCHFKNYDLIQPKNCFSFERRDWMTVQPKELPRGSQLIMGLNPPFGVKAALANKFIDKALTFKPKLIILIVPKETKRLDQKRTPYDLVWEDSECLAGKAFYLPGSLDQNDKIVEGWNASTPPLYLWSHPDWTKKHRKVAQEHNHISIGKISHNIEESDRLDGLPAKKEAEPSDICNSRSEKDRVNTGKRLCNPNEANISVDTTARKQAKVTNKHNMISGKEKESRDKIAWDVREGSISDDNPVKEASSEEGKPQKANLSGNHHVRKQVDVTFGQMEKSRKERENGTDDDKRSHDRSTEMEKSGKERKNGRFDGKRSHDMSRQMDKSGKEDKNRRDDGKSSHDRSRQMEKSGRERDNGKNDGKSSHDRSRQMEKPGRERENGKNDGKKSHDRSRNRTPDDSLPPEKLVEVAYEERRAMPEESNRGSSDMSLSSPNINNAGEISKSHSPFVSGERSMQKVATYQGSYLASDNGYNDAFEGKNDPTIYTSTDNSSGKYSFGVKELSKQYAVAPTGGVYSLQTQGDDKSFCRGQSLDEWNSAASIHHSRYLGQFTDGCVPIPSTLDAQAYPKTHGGSSAEDYLRASQYSLGSSGAMYGQPASNSTPYGFSGTTVPRGSVMDKYAPGLLGHSGLGGSVMDKYSPGALGQSAPGSSSVMDKYIPLYPYQEPDSSSRRPLQN